VSSFHRHVKGLDKIIALRGHLRNGHPAFLEPDPIVEIERLGGFEIIDRIGPEAPVGAFAVARLLGVGRLVEIGGRIALIAKNKASALLYPASCAQPELC